MANGLVFARVEVVVCEANEPLRRNIRELLRQLGFGEVAAHEKPADCLPLIERGPVDLLICDSEGDDDACIEMVHGIRHQAIDNNPFVISISLINQQIGGKKAIARAVNSGSDVLLAKPLSSATFADRIFSVANKRRPFVATSEYIGPTRRQNPRNKREAQMEFAAPNPVKEIASGLSRDAMTGIVRKGAFMLNRRKLHLNVEEIELRAGEVRDAIFRGVSGEDIRPPPCEAASRDFRHPAPHGEEQSRARLRTVSLDVRDR